jgi:hypothetical protein
MKKHVILAMVLLAAYGISMGVMWSRYEPRDEHVEFQSDFRDRLAEFSPATTLEEVPVEIFPESRFDLSALYTDNAKVFRALTATGSLARDITIPVTVEAVKSVDERGYLRMQVLVRYLYPLPIFTNDFSPYIDTNGRIGMVSHSERYDWPGDGDWTATNLSYDGGDFHYDNKSDMWFWTYMSPMFLLLAWLLGCLLLISASATTKRPK